MSGPTLTEQQVERFIEDGFVRLKSVVSPEVSAAGREVVWDDLSQRPDDPSSWIQPVVRLLPSDPRPFHTAFESAKLHGACDQLVGVGRWVPRQDLGLVVVRFPHHDEPDDTGWHIDASFPPDERPLENLDFSEWRVNVFSRARALLMLFLLSDVGPEDAPTRIKVGSHLDVPSVLRPAGEAGMTGPEAYRHVTQESASRPTTLATGKAGDVYLCHPFLVHAAQPVRGTTPRVLAQPPLANKSPCVLNRPDAAYSPVETAIRRALKLDAA